MRCSSYTCRLLQKSHFPTFFKECPETRSTQKISRFFFIFFTFFSWCHDFDGSLALTQSHITANISKVLFIHPSQHNVGLTRCYYARLCHDHDIQRRMLCYDAMMVTHGQSYGEGQRRSPQWSPEIKHLQA